MKNLLCNRFVVGEEHQQRRKNNFTIMNKLIKLTNKGIKPLLVFILCSKSVTSQVNLVPNPSFEVYIQCPKLYSSQPTNWFLPTSHNSSPNYLNVCGDFCNSVPINCLGNYPNYQYPRTGNAYADLGFFSRIVNTGGGRIYYETKLTDSINAGRYYHAGYYINLANGVRYASNNAGMLFTKEAVYVDTIAQPFGVLAANPQIVNYGNPIIKDTQNWVKISGIFKAQGGEQYITLGNFRKDTETNIDSVSYPVGNNWAVYALDDVFVTPLDNNYCLPADAGRDTTITQGDSVFIGSYTNGIDTIKWLQNGIIPIDSTRPGFWVKPLVSTFYVVTQTVNGCTAKDTVWVTVNPLPLKFMKYDLRFTNERQVENNWSTANEVSVSHFNIQRSINGKDFITIGKVKASNKVLNEYNFIDDKLPITTDQLTLYYRVVGVDNDGKKQYTEIRNIKLEMQNGVSVYPNPAKDVVNIVGKDIKEVRIINYLGQLVHQEIASYLAMTSTSNKTNHLTLNTNHYSKGLYIVQVILINGTIKNEKLVVE